MGKYVVQEIRTTRSTDTLPAYQVDIIENRGYCTGINPIRELKDAIESIGDLQRSLWLIVGRQNGKSQYAMSMLKMLFGEWDSLVKKVIFHDPATIVFWSDGTKTVVKCQEGDIYDKEKGLAMCFMKKACGNGGRYNNLFKRWIDNDT